MRRAGIFAAGGNSEFSLFRHDNDVRIRGDHGGGADAGPQNKGNLRDDTGESSAVFQNLSISSEKISALGKTAADGIINPTTGAPVFTARSYTFLILAACALLMAPPATSLF